jgi:hypothetical protein
LRKSGCLPQDEFTVLVVRTAQTNELVYGARVTVTESDGGDCKKGGGKHVEIKFPREVSLDGDSAQFKVQIVFHRSGEYPAYDHLGPVETPKFFNANTMVNFKTPKNSGIITSVITTKPRGSL